MENFHNLGLPEALTFALDKMQFSTPTPIQAQAIPVALEGHDILGSAQTGTGKTFAFGIPALNKLMQDKRGSVLIMTPTRELAVQVIQSLQKLLLKRPDIKTALLIGGEAMPKQFRQLNAKPRLVVGTPGRINDHLKRGSLMLNEANFLVLDETDRMLDMGFTIQIEEVLKYMPKQRQTLLFSATMPKNIISIAQKYLKDPVHISVGATSTPVEKIKQETLNVTEGEKFPQLLEQLDKRSGSIIIFVKTKRGADKMARNLRNGNYSADAIHGDLRHNKREQVIKSFRNRKNRILVATDIAARGLDIPHIEHVINYDLPQCPEDYIHRIGRTARAGAEGEALCLLTPSDKSKWREITRLLNPGAAQEDDRRSPRNDNNAPRGGNRGDRDGRRKRSPRPFRFKNKRGNRNKNPQKAA